MQPRLVFDIETAASPESLTLAPEPVVNAPSNYKDPEKIKEYVERESARLKEELVEKAALDPDYGQVLSIGLRLYGPDQLNETTVFVNRDVFYPDAEVTAIPADAMHESGLLWMFWKIFADCGGRCVGFNILSFDLPFLMRRSMALGVSIPLLPMLAKYRTEPVTDLYGILYNWAPGKSLKTVARLYKIENECPGIDGSCVKDLSADALRAYQRNDVAITTALYEKMNGVYFAHTK